MTDIREHNATPRAELERQIMDPNIPKNEREWWAAAEIERLRKLLFDITVSWHCGPASADSDDLAKLIKDYDAHSVPGPWNDATPRRRA